MKKMILIAATLLATSSVFAKTAPKANNEVVKGDDVLVDHQLNQYADEQNPPQGFEIQIPAGYTLEYVGTPDDGGGKLCVATTDKSFRVVTVTAPDLETDEGGCYAFLIITNSKTYESKTVSYYIEQSGT